MSYQLLKTSGKNSKVDFHRVKELRWEGNSYQKIGEFYGVSKQYIEQICKKYNLLPAPESPTVKHPYEKYYQRIIKNKQETQTGCWEWQGALSKEGYSRVSFKGEPEYGHRVSYRVFKGDIPEGMCICHSCDNPKCINPDHLWLGTHQENMQDRDKKQRHGRKNKKNIK